MFKRISTRSWLLALALSLCLSGCMTAGERANSESSTATTHVELPRWTKGTTYRYETRLQSDVTFTPATQQGFDFGLTAVAELTPVRVEGDEVEMLLQLSELQLASKSAAEASDHEPMAKQLREPYMFTLKGGRLHASRMAAGVDAEGGSVLRSLSSAFQVVAVESAAGASWKVAERDATGEYTSEYTSDGAVLHKKKLEYTRLHVSGDVSEKVRRAVLPRVLESQATFTVRESSLQSVAMREHVESSVALDQKIGVRTTIDLRQLGRAPAKPIDLAAVQGGMREVLASAPISTKVRKDRFDDIKINNVSFEDIVSKLESEQAKLKGLNADDARAAAQGGQKSDNQAARNVNTQRRLESFSAMAALLRQDASALPKALAEVRAGSVVRESLIDAIGSSGTPQAQSALIEIMQDRAVSKPLRLSAAMSLIRVKDPQPANVVALRALAYDPLLQEYALYGLGTASRRMRIAGSIAPAKDATDGLLEVLSSAKDDATRMRALRGISNSADVRAMTAIKPWLTDDSDGVRHAALDALRMMDHPDADVWIAERLIKDESVSVQAAAVAAAGSRSPSQRLADALATASLKGKDAAVRHRAVELASSWLESQPDLSSMLEQVAKAEPEQSIRELAQHTLAMAKTKK